MRKANWPQAVFNLINWSTHGTAFKRLTRQQTIYTSKLLHQLTHTNRRDNLLYGHDRTCTLCLSEEETFSHVLWCTADQALFNRSLSAQQLYDMLIKLHTPPKIVDAIKYGSSLDSRVQPAPSKSFNKGFYASRGHLPYSSIHWTISQYRLASSIPWSSEHFMGESLSSIF